MQRSKFDKLKERFLFLNQVVKSISRLEFNLDEIINNIDNIEVQQVGQALLSRALLNEHSFEVEDDKLIEVDYYDYERLFVIFDSKVKEVIVSDLVATCFKNLQPDYLVLVKEESCKWNNYYDKVRGEEIEKLKIIIFLVDEDFLNVCQKITNRF